MNIYNSTIPYFYIIRNNQTKILYAGSKWAEGCQPDTFMKEDGYQTSSPTIKSIIEEFGLDIFEILRIDTYCDGLHVYDYETSFLQTNDCAKSSDWYNTHNNDGKMAFGCEKFMEKSKQTCLERYGVENISQVEEIKIKKEISSLQNWGYEHTLQVPELREKGKLTRLEIYGEENYNNREKSKQTCLEKYGVDNVMKSPETLQKLKEVYIENYGYDHFYKSPEIKNKIKNTLIEIYGVDHNSKIPEVKEKKKKTFLEKYGVDNPNKRKKVCCYCGEYENIIHESKCKLNPQRNIANFSGENNPRAKTFEVISPEGIKHIIVTKKKLESFAKINKFNIQNFVKGNIEGWSVSEVEKGTI